MRREEEEGEGRERTGQGGRQESRADAVPWVSTVSSPGPAELCRRKRGRAGSQWGS